MKNKMVLPLLFVMASVLSGCQSVHQVQSWEKGNLAKPGMRLDADSLDERFTQHAYISKESASGGASVGGGGCGCN